MTKVEKQIGHFNSSDNTSIYYECRGSGEPIVFIYGIGCLINHWNPQISYFSDKFQTVVFDIRGHHKSARPSDPNNLTLDAVGEDVFALIQHLKLEKAHIVAHSFGAQALFKAYAKHPEIFKSITLVNGFSKNPIKGMFGLDVAEPIFHLFKQKYTENPELYNILWKTAVDNPLAIVLSGLVGGFNLKLTPFKDIEIYAKGVANIDLDVFLRFFEEMMNYDATDVLTKIDVPTLIISGERDMVTPQKFQTEMHNLISGSELMVVPYGSHCTQLDFPDFVNLKLEKFISQIK